MSVPRLTPLLAGFVLLSSAATSLAATATVSGVSRIYLRSGPGTTYSANGVVAAGEPVTTLEAVGNWHRVETADGRTGYLYSGYLTFDAGSGTPQQSVPPTTSESVASGADPAGTAPASPAPGEPARVASPVADAGNVEAWREELTSLKAEVSRLRAEVGSDPAASADPGSAAALTLPTRAPVEISPNASEASNLRTAGVAALFLVVGWIFGAGFARRRTRSQRGRLRF